MERSESQGGKHFRDKKLSLEDEGNHKMNRAQRRAAVRQRLPRRGGSGKMSGTQVKAAYRKIAESLKRLQDEEETDESA